MKEKFVTPHLVCSFVEAAELLFLRESSLRLFCIPKANLYSNQCVLQLSSHYHKSSLLPDHFLMVLTLQFDEVWLSGSIGAKSSRNLQLHSQPSMELSVPNPIAPLCQLTQVFASSKLSMPEPL